MHNPTHPTALDQLICADATTHHTPGNTPDILVLDDPHGTLTRHALHQAQLTGGRVLTRQRSYTDALNLWQAARTLTPSPPLHIAGLTTTPDGTPTPDPSTYTLADFLTTHNYQGNLALGHLPKSHAALADIAHDIALHQQGRDLTLILGANTKHMTPAFNQTLAGGFSTVMGLRGKGKHRCLLASQPLTEVADLPQPGPLTALGGVFSGPKPDAGGELLADAAITWLHQQGPQQLTLLDLGCGNGSVTRRVLGELPAGTTVTAAHATDLDLDAVRSASINLAPHPAAQVTWDNAAGRLPDHSIDLLLLNPPFHTGTTVDLTLVIPLLDAATRLLSPQGRLFLVHNSHARYRPQVQDRFTTVQQVTRTKTFTVLTAHNP